jgi:regulatory protein
MDETDARLAPVSYLFGPAGADPRPLRSSVSSRPVSQDDEDDEPRWNDAWGSEVDDVCAQLSDAETEKLSLKALGRRPLSRRELERTLRDRGVDDESASREGDRLTRVGLLDDAALAQTLVASLQERKGLGRTAIAAELARRMLAPAAIEYALELIDTGDELARAREVARKRASQMSSLDRETAARRLSSYLARRGYSGSTVRAAVEQALPHRQPGSNVRFR